MILGESRPLLNDSVVHLIRGHAETGPATVAIEHAGGGWTYRELWQRVLEIAAALGESGVEPGDRVVLWANRTPDTIAAAVAIMALRAAYVPIDPKHPAERVKAILAQAKPAAVVADGPVPGALDLADVPKLVRPPERDLPRVDDIAYAVFTSGSTGTPKGVLIEHGSLVNYVGWCGSLTGRDGTGSPLFASLGFDLAFTSLWVPLAQGDRVVVASGMWDSATLFGRPEPYSFLKLTPSHARFLEQLASPPDYRALTRLLMFGGEALDPGLLTALGDRLRGVRLVNHYGPTETTIGCCAYEFAADRVPALPTVPIGSPAWNTVAHVVDDQLRPAREGELVIAGRPVAAGYLGLTSDRFLDTPELGGRAYRTGDIVEMVGPRTLRYLGRRDDQLKISGHRIELGELRHHVLGVPGVAGVAFEVVHGMIDEVEAFVVPADPSADGLALARAVRTALRGVLPEAVVPDEVHVVPRLVLTGNGKCDVRATRSLALG
ncbi:amino acid adenylation domain-containing protein [Lentzea albidocapillata]|uniref:amino acid adenylation domain-containing protein n=1 Tax=Lentzea albidocapillata TaxID=40571 RepID=UPI0015A128DE|nr:amino acid adenylation domain-containing protein [Lentzea albidocapillata]